MNSSVMSPDKAVPRAAPCRPQIGISSMLNITLRKASMPATGGPNLIPGTPRDAKILSKGDLRK